MNIKIRLRYFPFLAFLFYIACNGTETSQKGPGIVEDVPPRSKKATEIVPLDPSIMTFALQGILPFKDGEVNDADSVRILNSMMYCGAVDQSEDLQLVKVPLKTKSGVEQASLTYNGEELIRVIAYRNSDGINFRQRIYFKDGEMVYFRERYLNKRLGEEALDEFYVFFESGEITKILGRNSKMETGEKTSSPRIRDIKLTSKDDKVEEYKERIKEAWMEIGTGIKASK